MRKPAQTLYPVMDPIRQRWSPRAFDAERAVSDEDLRSLFEAARWAPSSRNEQPWRFLVARRETDPEGHARLFGLLNEGNRAWAGKASILMIASASMRFGRNERSNRHAWYDLGQAMANLSAQATARGLVLRQMGGFDAEAAQEALAIPDGYEAVVAVALGYPGDPSELPETLQEGEMTPRKRRPLDELVHGASWDAPAGFLP